MKGWSLALRQQTTRSDRPTMALARVPRYTAAK
jgi:hypothetical protein